MNPIFSWNRGAPAWARTAWSCIALVGLLAGTAAVRGAPPVAVEGPLVTGFHTLRGLSEAEARQLAQPLLSPTGRVGYMPSRHRLILYDTRDRVAAIQRALEQNDFAPVNLQIRVFNQAASDSGARGAGVDELALQVGADGAVKGRAKLQARDTRSNTRAHGSQFVTTLSGQPARIWVGATVAEPQWVFEYGCGRGWWRPDTVWQEIGASLWVLPRLLANGMVEVELYPRLTLRGPANRAGGHDVELRELSTTVVAAPGQRVPLGGVEESRRSVYRQLLGRDSVFNGESFALSLEVTVLAPPGPPPARTP